MVLRVDNTDGPQTIVGLIDILPTNGSSGPNSNFTLTFKRDAQGTDSHSFAVGLDANSRITEGSSLQGNVGLGSPIPETNAGQLYDDIVGVFYSDVSGGPMKAEGFLHWVTDPPNYQNTGSNPHWTRWTASGGTRQ